MKTLVLFLCFLIGLVAKAQKINADKITTSGDRLIVVSRTAFGDNTEKYSNSFQLAYFTTEDGGEQMYAMDFHLKRSKKLSIETGRVILFKTIDGEVIESKVNDIDDTYAENRLQRALGQYDVYITGFCVYLSPAQIKSIVKGKITKIRLETADFNEDIIIENNSFSDLLAKGNDLIEEKLKEKRNVYDDF